MRALCSSTINRLSCIIIHKKKLVFDQDKTNNGTNSFTFAHDLNILNTCSAMWLRITDDAKMFMQLHMEITHNISAPYYCEENQVLNVTITFLSYIYQ